MGRSIVKYCKKCDLKRRKIRAIDIKKCPICNSEFYNLDYILWD